jgi:dTDP-4-dehydrorhamnose reductase
MNTTNKRVLVIGRSGQLANELRVTAPTNVHLVLVGRDDIDLSNKASLAAMFEAQQFDVVINTSAYTAVDKAETDVDAAYALNQQAVENIAVACNANDCLLVHVSTDFVFGVQLTDSHNSRENIPWKTDDVTNPQGVYAQSKRAGEQAIQATYSENSVIIRTSWLYSSFGNNFVKTMLGLMNSRPELAVVSDQMGSPTYARGLAGFIWRLLQADTRLAVYHWSDAGATSWHGFAEEIAKQGAELGMIETLPTINTTTTEAFAAPAPRPAYSVMDCAKAYELKSATPWQQHLSEMLHTLKAQESKV